MMMHRWLRGADSVGEPAGETLRREGRMQRYAGRTLIAVWNGAAPGLSAEARARCAVVKQSRPSWAESDIRWLPRRSLRRVKSSAGRCRARQGEARRGKAKRWSQGSGSGGRAARVTWQVLDSGAQTGWRVWCMRACEGGGSGCYPLKAWKERCRRGGRWYCWATHVQLRRLRINAEKKEKFRMVLASHSATASLPLAPYLFSGFSLSLFFQDFRT